MDRDVRPRLASKARLRPDRQTGGWLLLYPERALALNATAVEVVQLCTGEHSVADMVARLAARHGTDDASVERDVRAFLDALTARGLLVPS